MSSKSHEKSALTKGATIKKNQIDVANQTKVALWRETVLSSRFAELLMIKVMTGRHAWEDQETGEIELGEELDPNILQGYEKMILSKAISTPKEIVESSSDGGAGSLKAILAEIRDETKKNNESSDRPVIDVDLNSGGDVDF
jgi:hypothetical protein